MSDLAAVIWSALGSLVRVIPLLILSGLATVLIEKLNMVQKIKHVVNRHVIVAVMVATAIGAFSPLCSCTVVPAVSALLLGGVPLPPVMSFWMASPSMDPEIFILSAGVLGWPMAVTRLVATFLVSLGAGYLTLVLDRFKFFPEVLVQESILQKHRRAKKNTTPSVAQVSSPGRLLPVQAAPQPAPYTAVASLPNVTATAWSNLRSWSDLGMRISEQLRHLLKTLRALDWGQVARDTFNLMWRLGLILGIAFLLEALIIKYMPKEMIVSVLGHDNVLAVPLAALLGIPLYFNNVSALPIVQGLMQKGMDPGAAISFFVAGPVTTFPAMMAVWLTVRRKVFVTYLGIGLLGAVLAGYIVRLIWG